MHCRSVIRLQTLSPSNDSLETHRKFVPQHGISFPLSADDGSLKKLYSTRRTTYVIDQKEIIRVIAQGVPVNLELLVQLEVLSKAEG